MNAMRLGLALTVALLMGGCMGVGSTSATRQRPSPTASAAQSGIGQTECVETARQVGGRFAGHPAWIQADPATSGLYAILLYGNLPLYADGKEPNGAAPKIIWLADPTIGGHTLDLALTKGGTTESFKLHATWFPPGDATPIENFLEFGQGLLIPSEGCWRVDISSGDARGSIMFWVKPAITGPSP
jgi:hypothetical protein